MNTDLHVSDASEAQDDPTRSSVEEPKTVSVKVTRRGPDDSARKKFVPVTIVDHGRISLEEHLAQLAASHADPNDDLFDELNRLERETNPLPTGAAFGRRLEIQAQQGRARLAQARSEFYELVRQSDENHPRPEGEEFQRRVELGALDYKACKADPRRADADLRRRKAAENRCTVVASEHAEPEPGEGFGEIIARHVPLIRAAFIRDTARQATAVAPTVTARPRERRATGSRSGGARSSSSGSDDGEPPAALAANDARALEQMAEESVLGALLLAGWHGWGEETLQGVLAKGLEPDHFYCQSHAAIFSAMLSFAERNGAGDRLCVESELERRGTLEAAGGKARVRELADSPVAAGNAPHFARLVVKCAARREQFAVALELQRVALSGEGLSPELIARLRAILGDPGTRSLALVPLDLSELLAGPPPETYVRLERVAT